MAVHIPGNYQFKQRHTGDLTAENRASESAS